MNLKLDENLGATAAALFRAAGHDARTVRGERRCRTLIAGLAKGDIAGKLWIVQPGRLREYRPESEEVE